MLTRAETWAVFERALGLFTKEELARALQRTPKTLRRWEIGQTEIPPWVGLQIRDFLTAGRVSAGSPGSFSFVDLFAGIGGIRLGFQRHGGRCVFTSEWDRFAARTYRENFPDGHEIHGDIRKVDEYSIADHDMLLAGFPCQPFSIAGVSKKKSLGREHGFRDRTQGTLFYDVARIIAAKRPKAFLLENVKNLQSHDRGETMRVILETLRDELGYHVPDPRIVDARYFVPQHRERILIVGFREPTSFDWNDFRTPEDSHPVLRSVLHPEDGSEQLEKDYTVGPKGTVNSKYMLSDKLWNYLQQYAEKHRAAGNGFGFGRVGPDEVARTLSARYYKDGSEILVDVSRGRKNPRRLTPRECARLMGFRDTFRIPVSDTQAYKQFGNSVVVPVMEETARIMVPHVLHMKQAELEPSPQVELFQ